MFMLKSKPMMMTAMLLWSVSNIFAQKIQFTEYDLDNGLHVILHKDNSAPVVAVTVLYHVGSKNEDTARTGFAHFFEHLLFEGTENIKRGEYMKLVSSNGGQNNAYTTQDKTFYYEVFPSNQLELGLWLESERMMHPVINEIGVRTQNEVVKEEKRQRYDNSPYGMFFPEIYAKMFTDHPYHWTPIGSMAHLDAAKLDEFKAFFKKFYIPNNAVLSIAGDIDIQKTKDLVKAYFADIPRGADVKQVTIKEAPITKVIIDTTYDDNIQIPAIFTAYRTPGMNTRESMILQMLSSYLSDGASSKLYKKMVDEKKEAVQVASFNSSLEDYGVYVTLALPNMGVSLDKLLKDIDEEIASVRNELISENDYHKILNKFENDYVTTTASMQGLAETLSEYYTFYHSTNRVNDMLNDIRSVTREEMREVAKKYLNDNQRLILYYLPSNNN